MHFNYDAKYEISERLRFAPPLHIIGFCLLISFTLVAFFPKDTLLRQVASTDKASQLTADYLSNIVSAYPTKYRLRLALIEQHVLLGQYDLADSELKSLLDSNAKKAVKDKGHWLSYEITKARMYASTKPTLRQQYRQQLITDIKSMTQANLTPSQLLQLATDAQSLNDQELLRQLYSRLAELRRHQNPKWYQRSAQIALGIGDYTNAADFYFLAMRHSQSLADKRQNFQAAIGSLQQGNKIQVALMQARQHIGPLAKDTSTLLFMTRIAMSANKPKLAEQYISRALKLRHGVTMHE